MQPNNLLAPHLHDFFVEAATDIALLFGAFILGFAAAAVTILNSAHGHVSAWNKLRDDLRAIIPSEWVAICSTAQITVILPTSGGGKQLPYDSRRQLAELARYLRKIEYVQTIILTIRQIWVIGFVGMILASVTSLVLSGPVLFGYPPLAQAYSSLSVISLVSTMGCTLMISHYCSSTFSGVRDYISIVSKKIEGANLVPLLTH